MLQGVIPWHGERVVDKWLFLVGASGGMEGNFEF